jgi:hypothetical protein
MLVPNPQSLVHRVCAHLNAEHDDRRYKTWVAQKYVMEPFCISGRDVGTVAKCVVAGGGGLGRNGSEDGTGRIDNAPLGAPTSSCVNTGATHTDTSGRQLRMVGAGDGRAAVADDDVDDEEDNDEEDEGEEEEDEDDDYDNDNDNDDDQVGAGEEKGAGQDSSGLSPRRGHLHRVRRASAAALVGVGNQGPGRQQQQSIAPTGSNVDDGSSNCSAAAAVDSACASSASVGGGGCAGDSGSVQGRKAKARPQPHAPQQAVPRVSLPSDSGTPVLLDKMYKACTHL